MTKKYKSVRVGTKVRRVGVDIYSRWRENAERQGLTMEAYLSRIITDDEDTLIPKAIAEHIGELDILFAKYVDPLFTEVFQYYRAILLRAMKLDKKKRREFLKEFSNQLEKEFDSMVTDSNKKRGD